MLDRAVWVVAVLIGLAIPVTVIVVLVSLARQNRQQADLSGFRETFRELRDDLSSLRAELQAQRSAAAELAERVDFTERVLAQLREPPSLPPPSPS